MLLSPGIETKETSLQTTVVNSATGRAALVGKFSWGPAFEINQVSSEVDLVDRFGAPDNNTADSFFSGANFLRYGNDLRLVRVVDKDVAKNASNLFDAAICTITSAGTGYTIGETFEVEFTPTSGSKITVCIGHIAGVSESGGINKYYIPSADIVRIANEQGTYPELVGNWTIAVGGSGNNASLTDIKLIKDGSIYFPNDDLAPDALGKLGTAQDPSFRDYCDLLRLPTIAARFPGELGNDVMVDIIDSKTYHSEASVKGVTLPIFPFGGTTKAFNYKSISQYGPTKDSDQFLMVVYKGGVSVESVVLSLKKGDKDIYGSNIYVGDFFENGGSRYLSGSADYWEKNFHGRMMLGGGTSGNSSASASAWIEGWELFEDRQLIQVNLMIAGSCAGESKETSNAIQKRVAELADTRKDTLAFLSPPRSTLVNLPVSDAVANIIEWRNNELNVSSSYATIDGNYKFQYDKYNDVNRWVPLAADIAGLCARTDQVGHPWMSPAGFNRGQIQGVIKLAIDTRQIHRDDLYQSGINPVVSFAGQGVILYGDKTASSEPTPFDRINVRRLFNMIKTNIGNTAQYKLFELNDGFTQMSFRSETNNYLDGIRSLGGMYDFRVVCDSSNNTPAVTDRNEFVATVLVKPARSINYIYLNFVATSTSADFDELIG